jgi:hypothetical protein
MDAPNAVNDLILELTYGGHRFTPVFQEPGHSPGACWGDRSPTGAVACRSKDAGVVPQRRILTRHASETQWLRESWPSGDLKVAEHVPVQATRPLECGYLRSRHHVVMSSECSSDSRPQEVARKPINLTFNVSQPISGAEPSTPEEDQPARVPTGQRGVGRTRPREDVGIGTPIQWLTRLSTGGTSQRSLWPKSRKEVAIWNFAKTPIPIKRT